MKMSGAQKNVLMLGAGLLIGTGLGILLLFAFWNLDSSGSQFEGGLREGVALPAPIVGSPAPDFELELLDGSVISLSELRGKPVLLNFWATWCAPCEIEMPFFQAQYDLHSEDFAILAINNAEQPARVQRFVDDRALTFPVLLDLNGEIQKLYQVRGYPTSLLVDEEGVIRIYHIGLLSENQLSKYLKDLGVGG